MALLMGAEILELEDKESRRLRFLSWELGELDIIPKDGRGQKRIRVLRVTVPVEDKPVGPPYWDITGQTLIAQLLPYLEQPTYRERVFTVTKYGVAPKARFQVQVGTT